MTEELIELGKTLAAATRQYVGEKFGELLGRIKALEDRPAAARGEKGDAGPVGERGFDGGPGEPGPQGPVGASGEPGAAGPQGPAGPEGQRGLDGAAGPAGAVGPQGDRGEPGPAGAPGEKGDPGQPGDRGERGEKGEPGQVGDPGERGEPGARGEKGDPGEVPTDVVRRLDAIEAKVGGELEGADIITGLETALQLEFKGLELTAAQPRLKKRVERDGGGRITGVIEEPQ